ncbi:hypothetical protein J6590_028008 [Homalodisca vitripennis]|nr:hypothetical protein J6590_028008 [Homalodisca vitripennis]
MKTADVTRKHGAEVTSTTIRRVTRLVYDPHVSECMPECRSFLRLSTLQSDPSTHSQVGWYRCHLAAHTKRQGSDWSRGGHVIQDGGRACAEGGHVREKFPHAREKFPHVREKFPPHTLILVFWGVLGCQNR